jgi:hypothetical protein
MSEKYICPCCGFRTLDEEPPGTYDICPVCYWEDDNVQYNDPSFAGGANKLSLNEARKNYADFGVSELWLREWVREPTQAEIEEKMVRLGRS